MTFFGCQNYSVCNKLLGHRLGTSQRRENQFHDDYPVWLRGLPISSSRNVDHEPPLEAAQR